MSDDINCVWYLLVINCIVIIYYIIKSWKYLVCNISYDYGKCETYGNDNKKNVKHFEQF